MADDRFEAYRAIFARDKLSRIVSKVHHHSYMDILEKCIKLAKRDEEMGMYDIIERVLKEYNDEED